MKRNTFGSVCAGLPRQARRRRQPQRSTPGAAIRPRDPASWPKPTRNHGYPRVIPPGQGQESPGIQASSRGSFVLSENRGVAGSDSGPRHLSSPGHDASSSVRSPPSSADSDHRGARRGPLNGGSQSRPRTPCMEGHPVSCPSSRVHASGFTREESQRTTRWRCPVAWKRESSRQT
jgi:hypothetical protein